ncbi:alpha/beta fold hydrolase [Promicromonospora sp. NPDC019610]|uniref:alpha/beta fold hydrolase n=1 Tax=Promicromonospora sp. NPDC019610 TaxID=3364405 RepID=UPI00378C29A3
MIETVPGRSVDGVVHDVAGLAGTELHYVSAGTSGSAILLVHGFPETWWTFHRLIPHLAADHRVVAVDLCGFGDSAVAGDDHDSATAAEDLHRLIAHLGLGPVHLAAQDIAGGTVLRLVATHPEDVLSLTAVEMGLAGFGLEALADVTHGGSWHIGALAAHGVPELLLAGRERAFLSAMFHTMTVTPGSATDEDLAEFARTYARPGAWRGAAGLYRSMLTEGAELQALAAEHPVRVPVLAVGAGGGSFTADTLAQVATRPITTAQLDGVGHHAALEAPAELAAAMLGFLADVDAG